MKQFISTLVKGMLIGASNVIPGISGGTMAFVLGIYERLTESIGCFFSRRDKQKEYFFFLVNIGIGIIIGFLVFARLITVLLGINRTSNLNVPFSYVPTFGFFLGLILGSIPVLVKIQKDLSLSWRRLALTILGLLVLFAIAWLKPHNIIIHEHLPMIWNFGILKIVRMPIERSIWLFFVGALAAFTMVIPGISGSALLVTLGEYGPILGYIADRSVIPLGFIFTGAMIGIILSSLSMTKLFEKRPGATFYFVLGLVLASCIQIFIRMITAEASPLGWLCTVITISLGVFTALQSAKLSHS